MCALVQSAFNRLFNEIGTVDQVGIEERVAKYTTRSIKKVAKVKGLKLAVSMVDLTTLEGEDTAVRIASVATAFPSGQAPLKTRLAEVKAAVADGADEIDMVINRGAFLSGEFGEMQDEIAAVVESCGDAIL